MEFELSHEFAIDLAGFLRIMHDQRVMDEQMQHMTHLTDRRVVAFHEEGNIRRRTVHFQMRHKFPGIGRVILVEESVFNTATNEFHYTVAPRGFEKFVRTEGHYAMRADGPNRTRRDVQMSIKVMIPGAEKILGKMMENHLHEYMDAEETAIRKAMAGEIPLGPEEFTPPDVVAPYGQDTSP